MAFESLVPAKTCILVFDLLEGHVNKDERTRARFAPVIANAARVVEAGRNAGAMKNVAPADRELILGRSAARLLGIE